MRAFVDLKTSQQNLNEQVRALDGAGSNRKRNLVPPDYGEQSMQRLEETQAEVRESLSHLEKLEGDFAALQDN